MKKIKKSTLLKGIILLSLIIPSIILILKSKKKEKKLKYHIFPYY
jgi:hypothetical protein